jgi:tetratricopeptide (TPR) repeat protein
LFFTAGRSGFAAAASRTLERADEIDDIEYQLGALWRLWAYRTMGGEYRSALALAERFRSTAARAGGPSDRAVGDRLIGMSFHYLGQQTKARHFLEAMLDGYSGASSKSHIELFQVDQRAAALSPLAKVLWLLGFPEQAARAANDAVNEADARDHPNSRCYALAVAACPVALLSGDLVAAERAITALVDEASRHRMDLWRVWGTGYRGVLLGHQGDAVGGSALLSGSLRELREKRYFVPVLGLLGDLAEALARAGRTAEALGTVDQAIARGHGTDEHWNLAELFRIKGEILLRDGSSAPDAVAEDLFAQSLALAQSQHARSWELRTATSLARLRHKQGRRHEARDLLVSVFERFNEGLATLDLRTARLLLDEDQAAARSIW